MGHRVLAWFSSLAALSFAGRAYAYRPFDGTDADVADVGVFELELGPAQFVRQGTRNYVLAPSAVLNWGIVRNLEVVVDFEQAIGSRAIAGESRVRWLGTDLLLKALLRPGTLQERQGISVALEAGPLLPELHGDAGVGAQANWVFSCRAPLGTLHLNERASLSRLGEFEVFSSVIAEGPESLLLRPAAELFIERGLKAGATTYSALLGAIWTASRAISVDGALRVEREESDHALEVRFGFTWAEGRF
jgi:hypothetical protein